MFQFQGIWLPDGEAHFPEWMAKNGEMVDGRGTYQIKKFRAAMEHVEQFRIAVDVGAHVGLWAMQMAKRFENVIAFEPAAAFRECFAKNAWVRGVKCLPYALGATPGRCALRTPSLEGGIDSGGTHVVVGDEIEVRTLDGFELRELDFLKIDVEGGEHHVVEGGRETIMRCRPTIIVEQKPHKLGPNFGIHGLPAVDLLKSMGYRVAREISGDYIMVPE